MKSYKIKKSNLFKEQEKKLPKNIKKELDEALEKISEDPYSMGKPLNEEDLFELIFHLLGQTYDLDFDEAFSICLSSDITARELIYEFTGGKL